MLIEIKLADNWEYERAISGLHVVPKNENHIVVGDCFCNLVVIHDSDLENKKAVFIHQNKGMKYSREAL